MTKTKLLAILAFLVALAAGGSLGVVGDRALRGREKPSWLGQRLNLDPEQKTKMRGIWAGALQTAREELGPRRRELLQQRRQKIEELLTAEQQAKYDIIMQEYWRGLGTVRERRRDIFAAAREKTRSILTDEQRRGFDKILENRPDRAPGMRGARQGGRPPGDARFPGPRENGGGD